MNYHRFSWFLFGLMIGATIVGLFSFGARTSAGRPSGAPEKPARFTAERVTGGFDNLGLYLVTDHQSGKAYLANYNGGIVEVAP